jgi:hypothetical protein
MKVSPGLTDPETRVRMAWPVAAGKKIALKTRANSLVRGTLVVEVEDIVWQRQLNTLRHFLLRNLHKELGEALVTEIDFRPMPRRLAPQRAETARPARSVDGIHDPVLGMLYQQSKKKETA